MAGISSSIVGLNVAVPLLGISLPLPKGDTFVNTDVLTTAEFSWSHGLSSRTAYTTVNVDMLQSPSML